MFIYIYIYMFIYIYINMPTPEPNKRVFLPIFTMKNTGFTIPYPMPHPWPLCETLFAGLCPRNNIFIIILNSRYCTTFCATYDDTQCMFLIDNNAHKYIYIYATPPFPKIYLFRAKPHDRDWWDVFFESYVVMLTSVGARKKTWQNMKAADVVDVAQKQWTHVQ